jgi:predicted MFS family arabinose efflux permease
MLRDGTTFPHARFSGWRVVLLCFLAQNLSMGLAFGSFGPLLASTEQHFGVTRAIASTGMSLMMLAIGLLSPLIGGLLRHLSVRIAMIGGALLSATGYWGLAILPYFSPALLMFGLIGAGVSLLAILGPLTLLNRWFVSDRAKMLSIVNLPIALFVTPLIIAAVLPSVGRFAILGTLGTISLLLIPCLLLIVEDPARVGQASRGSVSNPMQSVSIGQSTHTGTTANRLLAAHEILTSFPFWMLSLGIGLMAASGTVFMVHIVPFGMDKHMPLQVAASLLSVYGGAGIIGTLLFGWIADLIGPPAALVLSALCQALLWCGLVHAMGPPLFLLSGLLGTCVVPGSTLHGAALSELYGPLNISRAMGISYAVMLPFILGGAPFVGFLFTWAGGYRLPFLLTAGMLALACLFFVLMAIDSRRQKTFAAANAVCSRR